MNNLMRKQDVIDALHKEWDEVLVFDESGSEIADCCERVIDDLPSIEISSGEISETKKKIVIENYYESDITKETNLKEAFTRGFELGLEKAPQKVVEITAKVIRGQWGLDDECPCGKRLQGNEKYCPDCGAKLDWKTKNEM